ncbi:hypothetical protein JDV02_001587 [Purpureocillium takamizusanense]|uniref:Uncharacterized protein n=1 Tax=Purpureocillium takamizusanense TaxID=2060973 RepID=A0A9Q8Q957_9HYPO|nr:uncharacterized protein JDV02_001587 [Purpureocillium takamizusanense]UNI15012.1 hypothetical protein JDV02_001587 [Purpureocillium takamizusanense]
MRRMLCTTAILSARNSDVNGSSIMLGPPSLRQCLDVHGEKTCGAQPSKTDPRSAGEVIFLAPPNVVTDTEPLQQRGGPCSVRLSFSPSPSTSSAFGGVCPKVGRAGLVFL